MMSSAVSNPPTPLRGPELARAAVNHILDHPEQWDQRHWHCGTTHCFAGTCQVLAGRPADPDSCSAEVRELLGLTPHEARWLFAADRTLGQIHGFVAIMLAEADRDGRDRDGYDRAGYDRDGYDRAGYDRAGRDRDGRDRDGYDRDGRDRDGYDRDGRDRDGRDRDGRDRDGRDRDGWPLPKL
jgi:hypothetical protein